VLAGVSEYIGEDYDVFHLPQVRKLFCQKRLCPDVLQPNSVEHSCCGLPQTRRRIANHRFFRQALHHKSAELAEVHDVFELDSVAERTARGYDGILERNAGEAHAQVRSRVSSVSGGSRHGWLFPG